MVLFPNCKINLGLHILGKRSDGFHNLESVFYPLPIHDALEVIENPGASSLTFSASGTPMDVHAEKNIVYKACELLIKEHRIPAGINVHLHKAIPMGAGLGGGSADGAFALMLLNKKFQLGLEQSQLIHYAALLGSDCPFFIINKPCLVTGRGENLVPIDLDLSSYSIVVIHPGLHISTPWAFSQVKPGKKDVEISRIINQDVSTWKNLLHNDFEIPVFAKHPEIRNIKEELYLKGALYAALSGSGSSVFGIFKKNHIPGLKFPSQYFIKTIH